MKAARRSGNGIALAILRVVIGLVLGLLCAAAGLLVVGMGHGWGLPLRYGILSLLFYSLAMLRWRSLDSNTLWRYDLALTILFAVPSLLAAGYLDALPPAPHSKALRWLILAGVPTAYGLAGWWLERRHLHTALADAMLLVVGVLLDLAALNAFNGDRDGAGLAWLYPELVAPWLVLWLGWQAVAILAFFQHLRHRTELGA